MKLITRQQLANEAVAEWEKRAERGHPPTVALYKNYREGAERLGDNPDPDAIDRIVGNESWTHMTCNLCLDEFAGPVVEIGSQTVDTFHACAKCIEAAKALFSGDTNGDAAKRSEETI